MEIPTKTEEKPQKVSVFFLFLNLLSFSVPTYFSLLSIYFVTIINLTFIGHLEDSKKLAGAGLGILMIQLVYNSFSLGLNNTLINFIPQTFA
jgi:Na+-driven multidrug efflux pump